MRGKRCEQPEFGGGCERIQVKERTRRVLALERGWRKRMDEVADAASPQDTSIIQNSRRVIGPTVRYRPALSLAEFRVLGPH